MIPFILSITVSHIRARARQLFDGQPVDAAEHAAAASFVTAVSEDMVARAAVLFAPPGNLGNAASTMLTIPSSSSSSSSSPLTARSLASSASTAAPLHSARLFAATDANWHARVVELDLSHQRLRKLQSLERLVNLRKADF